MRASQNPNGDLNVCDQTIPVFDGEAALQSHPHAEAHGQAAEGRIDAAMSGFAVICAVKFIPIAGYQPDNPGIKLMAQTNEIEVWLVPLPAPTCTCLTALCCRRRRLWLGHLDLDPGPEWRKARQPRSRLILSFAGLARVNGKASNPNM